MREFNYLIKTYCAHCRDYQNFFELQEKKNYNCCICGAPLNILEIKKVKHITINTKGGAPNA